MPKERNPYSPLSKQEIKEKEQERKNIEAKIKATAEIGSACLSDAKFQKYREEFYKLKDKALKFMANYSDPDPIKDAFLLRAWINKLDVLQMLIDMVEKDTKRRI